MKDLGLKKLNVRELCILGMLCALTIVLGSYATLRIGGAIKVSAKFIPVYVGSVLLGPFWGGLLGASSDIASFIANPVAGFVPLITVAEFLCGFTYGLVFYKSKKHPAKVLLCVLFQSVFLDALLKTFALSFLFATGFLPMLVSRVLSCIINFAIQTLVLCIINIYFKDISL